MGKDSAARIELLYIILLWMYMLYIIQKLHFTFITNYFKYFNVHFIISSSSSSSSIL